MWGGTISGGLWKNNRNYAQCTFEHAQQSAITETVKYCKAELNELHLIGEIISWGGYYD
jgi:hypothetical protein